jgi:hypothetical protein
MYALMAGIDVSLLRNGRPRNSNEEEIHGNLIKREIKMLGHILSGFCRLEPKLIKVVAVGTVNVMAKEAC